MSFMPWSLRLVIPALSFNRVSSHPRKLSSLPALCAVLTMLVCAPARNASAQTAHFAAAQTTLASGLNTPQGVAVDIHGNVYFADGVDGVKEILAVNGAIPASPTIRSLGSVGDARGVAVDSSGNVYVADMIHSSVIEIEAINGSIPASPTSRTLGSGFYAPDGVAVDALGNVYVADTANSAVKEMIAVNGSIPASPTIVTLGSGFMQPMAVAVDGSGNVYVADTSHAALEEIQAVNGSIPASPTIVTLASGFYGGPAGVAVDSSGNVYVADYGNNAIFEFPPNGSTPATPSNSNMLIAGLNGAFGVAIDGKGNVYIADSQNNRVLEETPSGGNFGAVNIGATSPALSLVYMVPNLTSPPMSATVLTQGASGLDFASAAVPTCVPNTVYENIAGETCIANVTFTPAFAGLRNGAVELLSSTGSLIATAAVQGIGVGPQVNFLPGSQTTIPSGVSSPWSTAVDSSGNVYVADFANNNVFEISSGGSSALTSLGGGFSNPSGVALDGAGNVFVADYSNNAVKEIPPGCGSSSCVQSLGSGFHNPSSVAVDGAGNVYVTDTNNFAVKEIVATSGYGTVNTLASVPGFSAGLAVDGNGNLFVGNTSNNAVLEILAAGGYTTVNTLASDFNEPYGLAVDAAGNVFVANAGNNAVQEILAVNGSIPASPVILSLGSGLTMPRGVALDNAGNIYIADNGNSRVVKLDLADPPSLTFNSTNVPQTVTVENVGNAALTFPIPSAGNNPNITGNFSLTGSGSSACPSISSSSTANGTLPAGASCQLSISFTPGIGATLSGTVVLTDNNLNAAAPGYASQTIPMNNQSSALFALDTSVGSLTVDQNLSGAATIAVLRQNGFTDGVLLTASNLPAGVTASLNPSYTLGASILYLNVSSSAPSGTYTVTITGTSDSYSAFTTIALTVVAATPGFSLESSVPSLTISQGTSGTSTIVEVGQDGFNGSVNLAVGSLPVGVSASFGTNPTTYSSVLTLTAASGAPTGTYNIVVTGSAGSSLPTASTTVSLTVAPAPGLAPSTANFGAVNIGTASLVQTLTYTFGAADTLASKAVLTEGAAGLDFVDAGTGTCTANTAYTAGQSCTVNVTFTPTYAGTRFGAVVLTDAAGIVIATGYLQGAGLGPQVNFLPNTETTVASNGLYDPYGVAVDGSGNVYIADTNNNRILKETLSSGTYTETTIPTSSLNTPAGIAVDGSGNIYIADTNNYRVLKETPVNGSYTESIVADLSVNQFQPYGVAADGSGNVYFTYILGTIYVETLSGGAYTQNTIQTSSSEIADLAVDDSGNIYVADIANDQILVENPSAGGYTQSTVPTTGLGTPWGIAVDGNGNVYVTDVDNNTVLKETLAAGSYTQSAIATSALDEPFGVAVDGSGNVYIPDTGNFRVLKEDFADAPSLIFANTLPGSTSPDSPQTVTVENIGNAPLIFPVPSAGNNPTLATNFTLNSSASSACPLVAAGASAGSLPAGASCQLPISFTPTTEGTLSGSLVLTDSNLNAAAPNYTSQTIGLSGTATQATPTINWASPAPITYGTLISAAQLNATASVPGTFIYFPAAGTLFSAGQQTLTVTFTPNDTTNYTSATTTVILNVNQATPPLTWPRPRPITYGTALSATQLNASSTVAGTFTYLPAAGTIPNAGVQPLTVTFTPTDTVDYTTSSSSVSLIVNKAALVVTWAPPAAIPYGAALSPTQLDATSNATGTFSYSPAAGTVLSVGNHTLTVIFTPTTPADYTASTATASVTQTVNKATPTITWATPAATVYGTKLSETQLNASSSVAGTFSYSPSSGTVLAAGTNTLKATFTPSNTADYTTAAASVTLTVDKATPTITWATPKAITYGTALSTTQLNTTASVAGKFTYSPASETVLGGGSQTLTATFTPTNTTDYTTATASVTLTVNKATPAITWATPKAITYGTPLSAMQLDATSKVAGTFTYSPAAGTVLPVGNQKLTATFTPANSTDYTTATASVALTIDK